VTTLGAGQTMLLERGRIKRGTIKARRLQHRGKAAQHPTQMYQILSSFTRPQFSNYLMTDSISQRIAKVAATYNLRTPRFKTIVSTVW
jgi:hypothetical protein